MARKTAMEQIGVDLPDETPPEAETLPVAEVVEAPAVDETPAEARPDWLPQNFKSAADLAQSYKTLQDELRQRGERERQYEDRIQQLESLAYQPQQPQADPNDVRAQIDEAFENDPVGTTMWLVQQANAQALNGFQAAQQRQAGPQIEAQNELLAAQADYAMQQKYDDWAEVKAAAAERIREDPGLLPEAELGSLQSIQQALDRTYRLVKYDRLVEQQSELNSAGVGQAEVARAQKLQAQTLTGATGRPEPLSDADRQLAEMQAARSGSWAHIRATQ